MTESLFDAYLTGQLTPDTEPDAAAQRLAQLFKTTPQAMRALLTGKPLLLKRGLTREAALKYRQALQSAGVLVAFRPQQAVSAAAAPPAVATPLSLAPSQTELLRPDERAPQTQTHIDISGLSLAPLAPAPAAAPVSPPTPPISHLTLAPAGSEVLTAEERAVDTVSLVEPGAWSVAEAGAVLAATTEPAPPPAVTIDHLTVAAPEAELLQPDERRSPAPAYQLRKATDWRLQP